jgi:hypothetical protein
MQLWTEELVPFVCSCGPLCVFTTNDVVKPLTTKIAPRICPCILFRAFRAMTFLLLRNQSLQIVFYLVSVKVLFCSFVFSALSVHHLKWLSFKLQKGDNCWNCWRCAHCSAFAYRKGSAKYVVRLWEVTSSLIGSAYKEESNWSKGTRKNL